MQETITWISVDERLPRNARKVWTYGLGLEIEKRQYDGEKWNPPSRGLPVTHWAEMPKGPNDDQPAKAE